MSKPYVVGIDIGGTNTVFGIVDARGQVVASDSIKTQKHTNFDDYVAELHEGLSRLIKVNWRIRFRESVSVRLTATITPVRSRIRRTCPGALRFRWPRT